MDESLEENPLADLSALTSSEKFPHEKIKKLWSNRIDFAEQATKGNRELYKAAEDWYRGGKSEWKFDKADELWDGPRVSANAWHRIINVLVSFLSHSDPRVLLSSSKGAEFELPSRSLQKLVQTTYREMKYREAIRAALLEALFRNRSYVFQGWDSYRWLPSIRWCSEEVFLDPDANGDMKQAGWIAEQYTARLEDLLDDPEIDEETKKELREKKDLHVRTRVPGDNNTPESKPWDKQPGFTKVVAYRIYSREGLLPGRDLEEMDRIDEEPIKQQEALRNPHAIYKVEADRAEDAEPAPQESDPIDAAGRRVQILLVKGLDRIVKVSKWHMDHFDRDEFPYIRLQFNQIPGDADGVSMFESLRPLFIAKNAIISFAVSDAKISAQRRLAIDEMKVTSPEERAKVTSGKHLEAFLCRGSNPVEMVEFSPENPQHLALLPEIDSLIDETSGVNDAIKGQTGDVEKTKAEAMMLNDKATAALSYLLDPLERFLEEIARYATMACQRYVRRDSIYKPCAKCGQPCAECGGHGETEEDGTCESCAGLGVTQGSGQVPGDALSYLSPTGSMPIPCAACKATGLDVRAMKKGPIRRGADHWLSNEDAKSWPEELSVEQIRSEVSVTVEPGSTRRDYRERRVGLLTSIFDRFGPMFNEMGLWRSFYELTGEVIRSSELPNADTIVPRTGEFQEATQKIEASRQPPPGPPPPPPSPSPEELQIKKQEVDQKGAEGKARIDLERLKLQLEEMKVMSEVQAKRAESTKVVPEPVTDPLKQIEVQSKVSSEKHRLQLEERKLALEEAEMRDASAKFAEIAGGFQKTLAMIQQQTVQQAQAFAQQMEQTAQLVAQTAQTAQSLAEAARGVQTATSGVASALASAQQNDQRVLAEIGDLRVVMSAPVKVQRDSSGKVTGAVRDVAMNKEAA